MAKRRSSAQIAATRKLVALNRARRASPARAALSPTQILADIARYRAARRPCSPGLHKQRKTGTCKRPCRSPSRRTKSGSCSTPRAKTVAKMAARRARRAYFAAR